VPIHDAAVGPALAVQRSSGKRRKKGPLAMSNSSSLDPRLGAGAALWDVPEVTAVAAGGQHNLLLTKSGTVLATGGNDRGQADVPPGLSGVVAVAAGYAHSLALRSDGTVVAWGNNTRGATNVPAGLRDVIAISAGGGHSAAVRRDGSVAIWGQLGFGPIDPPPLDDAIAVASAWESCYALRRNGTVVAWGRTQLGETTVPADPGPITFMAAGGTVVPHWVFIHSDGTVDDGENDRRQGSFADVSEATAAAVGEAHALVLRRDGTVVGAGQSPVRQAVPAGLDHVIGITAGADHSLALRSDGTVVAWGKNSRAQLLGPKGCTKQFAEWQDDGYYLPALDASHGVDPYASQYGPNPHDQRVRELEQHAAYVRGKEYLDREELGLAEQWLSTAAEAGHIEALKSLGWLHNEKRGDPRAALRWWTSAADRGDVATMSVVAGLHKDAGEVDQAIHWYTRAFHGGTNLPL
jgi:hypothetical protein